MEKEKKKTLFTMKVEETDKGITVTCEGDACKDFMEKMKKGEIRCMPYYRCDPSYGCFAPMTCYTCCIPIEKEKTSNEMKDRIASKVTK